MSWDETKEALARLNELLTKNVNGPFGKAHITDEAAVVTKLWSGLKSINYQC